MTGAILGGTSVQQAAKLQMIIMFMISSSTALATMFTTAYAIATIVDGEHRIRNERIYSERIELVPLKKVKEGLLLVGTTCIGWCRRQAGHRRNVVAGDHDLEVRGRLMPQ